jgi:hypothetical protein
MNEYIEIQFRKKGKPLRVKRQVPGGIELDEPDPLQRTVYVAFDAANEITRYRMRRVRQLQGWGPAEFKLTRSVEDGTIVLRGVEPLALPQGRYSLRVRLQEARTRESRKTVDVPEDGHGVFVVEVETDDRQVAVDLHDCDAAIHRVLAASRLDDQDALSWLEDDWRPTRKACLLNLLASLRVRPGVTTPLIQGVEHFFWITHDRAYARVDRGLLAQLEALALHERQPFYREGRPKAPIHLRLLEELPEPPEVRALFDPKGLVSFRGEGRPSLQTVVAEPPPGFSYTYAEFDLDLGNPLQDVVGVVVHMGELLDGKPTNHLDMRKALAKTKARDFLYYTLS